MSVKERSDGRNRQKQIIDVSLDIIDKDGIRGLTLKKIGSSIGVSDAALLRHFRSKEEIVEAMAQKVFFENVVDEDDPSEESVEGKLSSLFRRQFAVFDSFPQSTAVLFQEDIFREYPDVRRWFITRRNERHQRIAALVKKGQSLNEIDPAIEPGAFATALMGTMRMAVMDWRDSGYSYRLEDRAEPLLDVMLKMIR